MAVNFRALVVLSHGTPRLVLSLFSSSRLRWARACSRGSFLNSVAVLVLMAIQILTNPLGFRVW